MASFTPPRPLPASPQVNPSSIPVAPQTPGPHKARLANMEGQINQLISQRGITERKHRSENAAIQAKVSEALGEVEDLKLQLARKREGEAELERCKKEGEQMRKELLDEQDLLYMQAQAVLANEKHVAEEILEVRRLAELGRITRDHKLSLFQAREAALIRENENLAYLNEELVAENEDFASAHAELNRQLDDIYAERDQLQSDIVVLQRNLNRAGKSRSGEMEKWEKEREEAESTIHSLQASHTKLVATISTQTTELSTLKAQLSALTAKEKKAREEKEAWVKEERAWEEKGRRLEAQVEVLEKEVRKGRDRISKEKDSKTGAEARLKEDLEEREEELLKQVEETKRVEVNLRLKEKELYALRKVLAGRPAPQSAPPSPDVPVVVKKVSKPPKEAAAPVASTSKPKKVSKPKPVVVEEDEEEEEDFAAAMEEVDAGGMDDDEEEVVADAPKKVKGKEKAKRPHPASEDEEPAPKEKKPRPKPKAVVNKEVVEEEEEVEAPKISKPKPTKVSKPKPAPDADDEPVSPPPLASFSKPVKKPKADAPATVDPLPDKKPKAIKRKASVEEAEDVAPASKPAKVAKSRIPAAVKELEVKDDGTTDSPVKEKKKKRKLGNGGTAKEFSWSDTTGAFPIDLSPIKGAHAPLPSRLR